MNINASEKGRDGSALMTAMGMIFIITLVAGGFYAFAVGSMHQTRKLGDVVRARAIAEAGVNDAVSFLGQPGNYEYRSDPDSFPVTEFAGGTFDVSIENSTDTNAPGRCLVTSVGTYHDATAAVVVDLRDANLELIEGGTATWRDFAIFANGDLSFNGSPAINGDVHTNNDFDLNGNDTGITGSVSAQNEADLAGMLDASKIAEWQLIPFPELSDPEFQALVNQARTAGLLTEVFGNKTYKNGEDFNISTNAITIIHGNVTILGSGRHDIDGVLYITGSLTGNGKAEMVLRGSLLAGGDILFNGAAGVFTYSAPPGAGSGSGSGSGSTNYFADVRVYATWQTSAGE